MASESSGDKDQPYFAANGAPAIDVDPGLVADYAALVGNRKVGTTAQRNAATGKKVWKGLEWDDTDLDAIFRYDGSGWVMWQKGVTAWTPTVTGITNKTVVAKYSVSGGRYFCDVRITASASPGVTAVPTVSTPVAVDLTGNRHVGMGQFAHGTSAFETHVIASANLVSLYPLYSSGSPAYVQRGLSVTDSLPFGFVSGDVMDAQFSFIPA